MTFRYDDDADGALALWVASDIGREYLVALFGEPVETVSFDGVRKAWRVYLRNVEKVKR